MKRRWLENQGLISRGLADDRFDKFFINLTAVPSKSAGHHISVLKVDDEIVATQIGVICKGRYVAHVVAYNQTPRFASFGAGNLLTEATIRECIDMGLTEYDFMSPGDAYKYDWSDAAVKVYDYSIPLTPKGRAFNTLGRCVYAGKNAFNKTSPNIRRKAVAFSKLLGLQ